MNNQNKIEESDISRNNSNNQPYINQQSNSQMRSYINPNRSYLYQKSYLQGSFMGLNHSVISANNEDKKNYIWGTNFSYDDAKRKITNFLKDFQKNEEDLSYYFQKLKQIKETDIYSMEVKATHIYEYDVEFYFYLIKYPAETILIFDEVVNFIYEKHFLSEEESSRFVSNLRIKVTNLKKSNNMRQLDPKDINTLVSLRGLFIRSSDIYPEMRMAFFQCAQKECGGYKRVPVDRGRIEEPLKCQACEQQNSMELTHNLCDFSDKQYIKFQERPKDIPEGETPININLIAYDDLVDQCKPGDEIEIIGIYRAQPVRKKTNRNTLNSLFKTYIDVVSICYPHKNKVILSNEFKERQDQVHFTQKEIKEFRRVSQTRDLYDKLVKSLAPSLYSLENTKLGLLCQLFGGTPKNFQNFQRGKFRNEINILMIGDPSTAKSQLLTIINKLTPRGIYTSGKGSSAVGLTAYITKDPETKEIILESGALVLSDQGICCIDEFDKMDQSTQSILHEVMEQQTISIAKQGIVCTLNARTAILAAANPIESRYNPQKSIVYNINLSPSLLSRFDLIFLMLDRADIDQDTKMANHIIRLYSSFKVNQQQKRDEKLFSKDFLTKYITYARLNYKPVLTDEAQKELLKGYLDMRKLGSSKKIITATPRQIESMIRLAESRAKMRLSNEVTRLDVIEAIRLIKIATQSAAIDPSTGQIDMNILTTGFSSSSKQQITDLVHCIKELMNTQEQSFLNGISFLDLKHSLKLYNEKLMNDIHDNVFKEAIKKMEDDQDIMILGEISKGRFTIKKVIKN